ELVERRAVLLQAAQLEVAADDAQQAPLVREVARDGQVPDLVVARVESLRGLLQDLRAHCGDGQGDEQGRRAPLAHARGEYRPRPSRRARRDPRPAGRSVLGPSWPQVGPKLAQVGPRLAQAWARSHPPRRTTGGQLFPLTPEFSPRKLPNCLWAQQGSNLRP